MALRGAIVIGLIATAACTTEAQDLLPRRDVFVDPTAPEGGDGERESPYSSIQEMVDKFDAEWGQVFLEPGVYEEDVVINRSRLWLMPARQYDVVLRGSITVERAGTIIRGMNIISEGSGIILTEGADGCLIQQNRIHAIGEGGAGIDVTAPGCSDCLISDNVVDLRDGEGAGRTGIRMTVSDGVTRNRLDHNQIAGCETGIAFIPGDGVGEEENVLTGNRLLANVLGLSIAAPGITARYNEFRDNAEGARVTGGRALLAANRFLDDERAVVADVDGVTLQSNVIARPNGPAVSVESGEASLLHNTLYSEGETALLLQVGDGASCDARWNIFAGAGPLLHSAGDLSLAGNLYSREVGATSADADAVYGDPGLSDPAHDDFSIAADSPAAHAAHGSEVSTDADGVGRPWGPAPSIGACEAPGTRETRTLHVAPGAENGDGSEQRPFDSIAEAVQQALPGDEVVVADGEHEFGEAVMERSGAPDAPIVIRAANPGGAVLVRSRLRFDRSSYLRIEGFRFAEPPSGYVSFGPYCRHCAVVNTVGIREVEGGGTGMIVDGPGSQHITFENNVVALNHGGVGIQIRCQRYNWHHVIRGNDVSGCYYGVQSGGGSYPTAPPGYLLIEGNVFHHNWKDGVHTKGTDQIICGNHFHDNTGHAITTRYGARNVIVGNWIHDNGNGMRLHSPSHFVINNVIHNNRGWGIHASSWPGGTKAEWPYNLEPSYEPPHEIWIAHNTIAGNGRVPIDANIGSRLMLLRNIIVGTDPEQPAIALSLGGGARQVEGNVYWNTRPPLLREYEGGWHSVLADPMLAAPADGDFRPLPDSPAWDIPEFRDALSAVLSDAPCGIELPKHAGASLPPVSEAPQQFGESVHE